MKDLHLIATLIPTDKRKLTKNAFCLDRNKNRYLPFTQGIAEGPTISSRKVTSAKKMLDDGHDKYDFTHRFQLIFDQNPMNSIKEYFFDINPQVCDILLKQRDAHDISGLHFCIIFDDIIDDKEKHLVLKNSSTNEMAVGYSGQATEKMRHHFIWILDLEKKKKIEIHIRRLEFKVELVSYNTCKVEYNRKVEKFFKNNRTVFSSFDMFEIDSYMTFAQFSQFFIFRQYSIYIRERGLKNDVFEKINKIIDVNINAMYVRKEFYKFQ